MTAQDASVAATARLASQITSIRTHVLNARQALQQALRYQPKELTINPWMVSDQSLSGLLQTCLTQKVVGLEHWPLVRWEANQQMDLSTTYRLINELLGTVERIRRDADHYHSEDSRLQRVLVEPTLGQIEIAMGNLRLSAAELGCLLHDEHISSYTIPASVMDGASC